MSDEMMEKPKPSIIKDADTYRPYLDPEALKALGLPANASFGETMATIVAKGMNEAVDLSPEQLEARFAEVAAEQGKTPEALRAEIEAMMKLPREELMEIVMGGPIGKLIEQDVARAEGKTSPSEEPGNA